MKYLVHVVLIGILLSGCADKPLKQASIEDRALSTAADKPVVDAAAGSVSTSGASAADVSSRALASDAGKVKDANAVETHGVVVQNPEAKALGNAAEQTQNAGKSPDSTASGGNSGQPDKADSLKYVAQPVLDPHNAQSPLAQRRLLFDYDSAAIRDEYRTLLEMHAQYLKNEKAAKVILQGHADERGSREYNLALGQRRSESVYKALGLLGVPEAQMEAVSLGEEKPVSDGHDENAWAQNRRAELLYQGD
ncbi:MAG: peptidoglycan-associated lipoprotein [Hydrogenophilales bacterium 28-61-23]|nr:MAG: peptidoglycan-associated lipoprotein [Hydrogenophilales bacterium 28-61-23]